MNTKRIFFVITLLAFSICVSSSKANAQQDQSTRTITGSKATNQDKHPPGVISGGVLNGKAISLPKPEYPQIARAARASGTVVVQVTIDEDGNIISASAISGHPLLKAASVQAAYGAKFSPTLLEGKPVKVAGTINYNFLTSLSWMDIGAELGRAEKDNSYSISGSVPSSLRSQQLEMESKELQELQYASYQFNTNKQSGIPVVQQNAPSTSKNVATIVGAKTPDPISNEEFSRRLNSVISSIQTKLLSDMVNSWYYSLGLIVGNAKESMTGDVEIQQIIERLRVHSISAPSGISEAVISKLQKLTPYSNKSSFDENDKKEINQILQEILNAPVQRF